jgi:hypothetical protein
VDGRGTVTEVTPTAQWEGNDVHPQDPTRIMVATDWAGNPSTDPEPG